MNFADPIDEAAEREQQMIEQALANRNKPNLTFTGKCFWCEEAITKGQYCDAECRHDHEVNVWAQQQRKPL